jgi:hypothetical protein
MRSPRLLVGIVAVAAVSACGGGGGGEVGASTAPSSTVRTWPPMNAVVTGPMSEMEACWLFNHAWRALPDRLSVETDIIRQQTADSASMERMARVVHGALDQIDAVEPYLPPQVAAEVPSIRDNWETTLGQFREGLDRPDWLTNPQALPETAKKLTKLGDIDEIGFRLKASACETPI